MRGSASSARAIEISWRSPAERPAPPSRTSWSRPPESRAATRSTPTAAAAAATSSSVASGFAKRMFDAIVPLKRNGSWSTTPSWRRYERSLTSRRSCAVDAHRARVRVVEAADEPRERRLAAAGLADEREAAARRRRGCRRRAAPAPCRTRRRRGRCRGRPRCAAASCAPGWSRISGSSSRMLAIFTIAAARRLQLAVDVRELLQRLEDELQQVERRDQRPDRQRVVREQLRADEEDARPSRSRRGTRSTGRRSRRSSARTSTARGSPSLSSSNCAWKRALAVERLHDRHPGDRLGDLRGHRADPVALLDERDVRGALEPAREDERRRQDGEDDEAEPPVGDEQRDDAPPAGG